MEQSPSHNKFFDIFCEGASKLGWAFPENVLKLFWGHYQELCRWEKVVNLTGLKNEKEKIALLFLDSLSGQSILDDSPYYRIVDIGTGAGFPGIPLQIIYPEKIFYLMDSRAKKAAFLINVVGKLNISSAKVVQQRIEDIAKLGTFHEKCDLAMLKGVNVSHITPYLHDIIHENGKLLVYRTSKSDVSYVNNDLRKLSEVSYELPFGYGNRTIELLEFQK